MPNGGRGPGTIEGGFLGRRGGGFLRAPSQPLRGKRVPSSCRTPTCSLLFSPSPFPLRVLGRRQPSPPGVTPRTHALGCAHAHKKARTRVNLGGGSRGHSRGGGAGGAARAVSAHKSPPQAGRCPEPARSTQAGRVSRLQVVPESRAGKTRNHCRGADTWGCGPLTEARVLGN